MLLCWMSLCWMSLCWMSLCWMSLTECRQAECRYSEWPGAFCTAQSSILPGIVFLIFFQYLFFRILFFFLLFFSAFKTNANRISGRVTRRLEKNTQHSEKVDKTVAELKGAKNDLNGTAHIRHQCRKTAILSCHRFLINSSVEKMNNI